MGAGWDQVRSRGSQFRSESGVFRIIRYLGGGVLPAVLEAVAVAVHLQDVNVVGEPVKQSAGEPLGAEHVGPLVEGQVGGDQDGAPFVALAEDLEEEFSPGGGQGDEAQLINDQQPEAGQLPLQVEQRSFVPGPPAVRFTSFSPARRPSGSPAREAARAYCGDMTTWSVAGGTSPRASLSM